MSRSSSNSVNSLRSSVHHNCNNNTCDQSGYKPWHIHLLVLFQSPEKWFEDNNRQAPNLMMGSPARILESAFRELHGKRSFYDLLVKDLNRQGLLGIDSLHVTMSGDGALAKRTTELGDLFVAYITSPF